MKPGYVAFLALLLVLASTPPASSAQVSNNITGTLAVGTAGPSTTKVFVIIVSSSGFNGSSTPFTLQVNQGDNLTIRFLYGETLKTNNPHQIKIEGYNVQTGVLDKKTPEQRISIIVGTAGKFQFHCIAPCYGMENLQNGVIDISPSKHPTEPVGTSLGPINSQTVQGRCMVSTRLLDVNGTPVAGALVSFFVGTEFGEMNIGQNSTGPDGTVQLVCSPGLPAPATVTARFGGNGNYLNSTAIGTVASVGQNVPQNTATPYVSGQIPLVDMRLVGIPPMQGIITLLVVMTVVFSIWSVYVFVVSHIIAIRTNARKKAEVTS